MLQCLIFYMWTFYSPKDRSDPHDVAVVQDIVREQGEGWVTLVSYTWVDNATGQEGTRLHRQREMTQV